MTAPAPPAVPSGRLVGTLALAGALAGLVLVFAHQATQPRIRAHQAERLRQAIQEVLGGPERFETLYVVDGALRTEPPAGVPAESLERVYRGFGPGGEPLGVAVVAEGPGYQDVVRLIFGYDPGRGELVGMKVLESKETPGLGDKIEKDAAFVAQFEGARPPLVARKPGATGAAQPGGVDAISGATISSRAVVRIIDGALERLGPALRSLETKP